MKTDASRIWLDFKEGFLKQNKNKQICSSWIEPIHSIKTNKSHEGLSLTLEAPSDLHKKWLQKNLVGDFHKYLDKFYQKNYKLQLVTASPPPSLKSRGGGLEPQKSSPRQKLFFNPDYSFENFIVGENSKLAFSAALAVTKHKKESRGLNPLFIYSPSGLGKTHLLNAVGNSALKQRPSLRIIYLSAERFLNKYVKALQNRQIDRFRNSFRKYCDLLLLDDVQILSRGREVQEEFFHTFNALYEKKVPIVVCCDRHPSSLPLLEERIRTRMEGGLMADIAYPDRETRMAILKKKAEKRGLFISPEGMEKISFACQRSVREMEGVLNKIKIMTELHEGRLALREIENILKTNKKPLSIKEIQERAAKAFQLTAEEIKSPSRRKNILKARQTAMYLVRKYMNKSLSDISLAFGKKDHTTAINSIKKVRLLSEKDSGFKNILDGLKQDLKQGFKI